MPYSYDKQRKKYVVRVTAYDKRNYIGRYDTIEEAERAEKVYLATVKRLESHTVDSFPLYLEEHDAPSFRGFFRGLHQRVMSRKVQK